MRRILVTVGTTGFDRLCRLADLAMSVGNFDVTIQYGPGSYVPVYHSAFRFIDDLSNLCSSYDLIVTHAGAGNVYSMLEHGMRLLVIPNLDRSDKHQMELASYLEDWGYCTVRYLGTDFSPFDFVSAIEFSLKAKNRRYLPEKFFGEKEIVSYFSN